MNIVTKSAIVVQEKDNILVVDSRLIAIDLGIEWEVFENICFVLFKESVPYLTAFDLLAIQLKADYLDICIKKLDQDYIQNIFSPYWTNKEKITFAWMSHCVLMDISHNDLCRSSEFGRVHLWFNTNYGIAIKDSQLIPVIAKKGQRPDFLIKVDGVIFPVECKLKFDSKAITQLQKYMKLWGVKHGYAVAPKFTVSLPNNIEKIVCP